MNGVHRSERDTQDINFINALPKVGIWSPHKKVIRKVGRIQGTPTKMIPNLRQSHTNISTLEEGRERIDLIAVYKVMKEKKKICLYETQRDRRGHKKSKKDTKKV